MSQSSQDASSSSNITEATQTPKTTPASPMLKKSRNDFEFIKEIGEGSFSTVYLARDKITNVSFAIKECNKAQILKEKKVKYVHLEKKILLEYLNDHPFFVKLCFTFQDEDYLYFGLSYCSNGDLLGLITKQGQFSVDKARFYSAEIVDALEYMHGKKVVHRDLKPENILLSEKFHIRLTDFGTARILDEEQSNSASTSEPEASGGAPRRRRNSFVGTAQFVAPEVLQGKAAHIGCDLWALGCIVHQLLTGKHLFTGTHEYDIFQKVVKCAYTLPDDLNALASDLIRQLVVVDPEQRLGASNQRGYLQLKQHEFFASIVWNKLSEQEPPS